MLNACVCEFSNNSCTNCSLNDLMLFLHASNAQRNASVVYKISGSQLVQRIPPGIQMYCGTEGWP